MDFAERYGFICQDSIQSYYYNNSTACVHPLVMYFKKVIEEIVSVKSFCIISNSLKQTASTVHIFQETVIDEIKMTYPWIKKIIYFSDGSPAQYKNK